MKKNIVILGSGESGTGAAILAQQLGYQVFVSDKSPIKSEYKIMLDQHGIEWEEGQHTLDRILVAHEVIKSPGIPEKTEVMKAVRAAGIDVIGEIEFAFRHAGDCKIVAITGSNGKTTTTMLAYHLLKTAGLNAYMGGNVGNSFAMMVADVLEHGDAEDAERIYVLEVSSFQLDDCQKFRPDIAILLNITPDHLDRYEYKMENYVASKFRITMNQTSDDLFVFNASNPEILAYMPPGPAPHFQARRIPVNNDVFQNRRIIVPKNNLNKATNSSSSEYCEFDMTKTALRGPHNMFNAACAIHAALALGAEPDKIQKGLETYTPPPHRLELVAVRDGITWINDSKATNVDSVFYALQAMTEPTVWIVGGQDKGNDYSPLFELVREKVKAIVCMGVDNAKLREVFGGFGKPMAEAGGAEEAVRMAADFAESGDTVLLSPACASFDLFKNYEDRGEQFKQAILNRATPNPQIIESTNTQ